MKRPNRNDYVSDIAYDIALDAFVAYVVTKSLEHTAIGGSVGEFIEDTFNFDWDD